MPLKGQAKKDYQRIYMRRRRSNVNVRPSVQERVDSVRPSDGSSLNNLRAASERLLAALGGPAMEEITPEDMREAGRGMERMGFKRSKPEYARPDPKTLQAERQMPDVLPKPQSYNPMVGYVPLVFF